MKKETPEFVPPDPGTAYTIGLTGKGQTFGSIGQSIYAFDQVKFIGGYQVGGPTGLRVNFRTKPSRWHRFWMRVCLGWTWVDA